MEATTATPERIVIVKDVANNRAAWLEARKGRLGASEMAAIAGLNKYRTKLRVWMEMTGKVEPENLDDNDAVWLGSELEPVVAKMFERKTGLSALPFNQMVARNDIPWGVASPDCKISFSHPNDRLLECKTTGHWALDEWDAGIPDAAHIQTMFQLGITGLEHAYVAALIGGRDFRYHEAPFDSSVFDQLVTLGENFMRLVKEDTPPAATALDVELLEKLHGKPQPKTVQLDCPELVNRYVHQKSLLKDLNKRVEEKDRLVKDLQAEIRGIMKDADTGICGKHMICIKKVEVAAHERKASSYYGYDIKENTEEHGN